MPWQLRSSVNGFSECRIPSSDVTGNERHLTLESVRTVDPGIPPDEKTCCPPVDSVYHAVRLWQNSNTQVREFARFEVSSLHVNAISGRRMATTHNVRIRHTLVASLG